MERKVVITGIGTINSIGLDAKETWENAKLGKLGISPIDEQLFSATKVKYAGVIKNYDASKYFDRKQVRRLDLATQYAIIASREAAKDSKLDEIVDRTRIGVNVTSGIGGMHTIEDNILKAADKGFGKISPMFIPNSIVNLVSGNVAIELEANGICTPLVTACASSTDAIGHAAMYIKQGLVDIMVAGGAEATINKTALAGFANMGALSKADEVTKASIPFDQERSGFIMGEGAATLVLEEYEHAKARGAKIYGFVAGYGATCDANHITAPDSSAKHGVRAAQIAINDANIDCTQINLVNAHGTSTPLNDAGENKLLNALFDEHVSDVHVTSTKSMTGHLLGATGALEALLTIKSLNEQIVTPTINTQNVDSEISLNVALQEKSIKTDYAMSFSLGFGGHNSVIVLKNGESNVVK